MDDIRWFAPNRYCTLPVPALQKAGLRIALEGDAPARLTVAADGVCGVEAFRYAHRHHTPLLLYLWDLPPWQAGRGRPDWIVPLGARLQKIPRPFGGYPGRSGYFSRLRFIAQRARGVWSPSTNTVRDVAARFGVTPQLVPFCYDSDRFSPRDGDRLSGTTSPTTLLSISRLVPYKNHAAVVRAAALITPRPQVHIIGRGPEAAALRALAQNLGVALTLDDTWASDAEIVAAYRTASLVVSPSRFEGFGLTPMEGIAMGVPVVASDIPPHREFVDGRARFFPLDDDAALARTIEAAIGEGMAGSGTALPDLTIEACADRFLPRLRRLLDSIAPG